MDTRTKILTASAVPAGQPLAVVTGYFDILRAAHVRDLAEVRRGTPHALLLAVVVQGSGCLLPLPARAELAASLRMVDYVLTAPDHDVDRLIETLRPAAVVRLEAEDLRRVSALKEHVRRRQG